MAVATDTGLITPILHKAETKGLASISNGVKQLAEKGRLGKLQPNEYQVSLINKGGYFYYFKFGYVWCSTLHCNY